MRLTPLDDRAPLLPPVTRARLLRLARTYAALWLVAVALVLTGRAPLVGLGASLALPGGAHLARGHVLTALAVLLTLALAVLTWWVVGAFVAPFLVWGADLVLAVALPPHGTSTAGLVTTFAAVPVLVVAAVAVHAVRHHRRLRTATRLNAAMAPVRVTVTPLPSAPDLPVREADVADLKRLRHAVDLALQSGDGFAGFDRRDQFREAALRYQLCLLGYAIASYRYTCAPAFSGWAAAAHARAIERTGERRVWGYWALENAWGRLSLGRDPVDNGDNIMLTGWQGTSVGMFESFGDDRFSAPGALTYRWSEQEAHAHDFGSLARSIETNMHRSAYTLFSCEPRWIYPVCNTFGVNTLVMHQRLHGGTAYDDLRERLRTAYVEEFHRPDGRVVGVRSETLGLSWSPWAGDGVWLPTTFWLHAAMPDLAHRSWWLMRTTVLREHEGRLVLPPSLANRCDSGSYAFGGEAFGQALLAAAAREIGDEEVATATLVHLERTASLERADGAARYADLSTQGNLYELLARFGRASGVRDLVGHGLPRAWLDGPRLADAAYPDVLVARAVTDGRALDCVLRPGDGGRRVTLVLDRLVPDGRYRAAGSVEREVVADGEGRARLRIDLDGRTELRVEPLP
ncbi:hypothetical protein GCM10027596_38440 [Nocardioides korecus]